MRNIADYVYCVFILTQIKCKSLEEKIAQAEGLTTEMGQLLLSLPSKEKDVLRRQVMALKSDLKFKMEQFENDRKKVKDFHTRLETVRSMLTEFEQRLSKVDENNASVKVVCPAIFFINFNCVTGVRLLFLSCSTSVKTI